MNLRLSASILAFVLLGVFALGAEDPLSLSQTKSSPRVDGVIADGEYALTANALDMQINLSWTGETLSVGVSGQTSGWVAVGLGSSAMNDAVIYIGFVSGDQAQLKVQKGAGHRHGDLDSNAPLQYAVQERSGQTTLEIALKASSFITKGQKQLEIIFAMGSARSFASMHKARYTATVSLTQ
jgi:hypothetical protein